MNEYKVKQLRAMLEFEQECSDSEKFGAHLTHWSGHGNPINLDEGALNVLIAYYEAQEADHV